MKTQKILFSGILVFLLLASIVSSASSLPRDFPDYFEKKLKNPDREVEPVEEFDYCQYSNIGDFKIEITEFVVNGQGQDTNWYPGDIIAFHLFMENTGKSKFEDIKLEFCLYDEEAKRCVETGGVANDFDLSPISSAEVVFGVYLNPAVFEVEKTYSLHIRATGKTITVVRAELLSEVVQKELPNPYERDFEEEIPVQTQMTCTSTKMSFNIVLPEQEDNTAPTINLLEPDNGDNLYTKDGDLYVDFEFKVFDESAVDFCELIIDASVVGSINDPETNKVLTMDEELETGTYEWKIRCVDVYGNEKISEERVLRIKKDKTDSEEKDSKIPTPKKEIEQNDEPNLFVQDSQPIVVKESTVKKDKISLMVDFLIPFFLFLIIVLVIIMIGIVASRKN